ncbi:MAG: hypothetical protein ACUVSQ_08825 [Pseudanabaenaceae cyanobacterium]
MAALQAGTVTVDPSALVAPGVILRADPGATLRIGAGVCLGMGCVLHATAGDLTIEAGVNLGAAVLVVGSGTVGRGACIGYGATLVSPAIAPGVLIPPGSLYQGPLAADAVGASETVTIKTEARIKAEAYLQRFKL